MGKRKCLLLHFAHSILCLASMCASMLLLLNIFLHFGQFSLTVACFTVGTVGFDSDVELNEFVGLDEVGGFNIVIELDRVEEATGGLNG